SLALWIDTAQRNPTSYTATENLGFAHLEGGQFQQAIAPLVQAVRLTKKSADAFAALAVAYDGVGRHDEADAAFQKAIQIDARYKHPDELVSALIWERSEAERLRVIAERN